MPPFHSRSTGAFRIDFISSCGVSVAGPMSSALRISSDSLIDLALRGKIPPPAEISDAL